MADDFESHRGRCFALAYRMLGTVADAEDIVQEAWLRWERSNDVESPGAWLTQVVTRLCLDHLKSARVRRERQAGPWLPEPIDTTHRDVVADAESISTAFLLLLERLSPLERAVFVLRQVFEVDYAVIATTLGKSEAAVRQVFHRARTHVAQERPRFAPSRERHLELLTGFAIAVQSGELDRVEALLAEDARAWNDGGGRAAGALRVIVGRSKVARLFLGLARKAGSDPIETEIRELNGWPALVVRRSGVTIMALGIETDGSQVFGVHSVTDPHKLARLGAAC